jgi:hypothetical protein
MTDMPGEAVAEAPQFTAEYWSKAPRQMSQPTQVVGINNRNGSKEFVCANGGRLVHPVVDIKQLVTVGTTVQVEVINTGNGQIVTGMFLPQIKGWAWKMSAEDLAAYAKQVADAVNKQRVQVRLEMIRHLKGTMFGVLSDFNWTTLSQQLSGEALDQLAEELATEAVIALEIGA